MKTAREKIKDAFWHYIKEKPYDKIRVSEIIDYAEVNRSTFYRNFEDVIALYDEVCSDLVDENFNTMPRIDLSLGVIDAISDMTVRALTPENAERIRLIVGVNGGGRAILLMRERFKEKLMHDLGDPVKWTEDMQCMATFCADYLTVTGLYILYSDSISFDNDHSIEYSFDYACDPIETFGDVLQMLNGGPKDIHLSVFLSTVKLFTKSDARAESITKLLSYSGFSRTVFYRVYNNKQDYFKKLGSAVDLIAVHGLMPLITEGSPHAFDILLEQWERHCVAVERKALILAFRDGYAYELGASAVAHLTAAYIDYLTERRGEALDEETKRYAAFFINSVVCCLTHYYTSLDRERFFRRMELLYKLRDEMKI